MAHDGAEMNILLVRCNGKLQLVIPTRLDDGWIAQIQLRGVQIGYKLFVSHCLLHAFGQLGVLDFLQTAKMDRVKIDRIP